MTIGTEVILFCQKEITESGMVLDEDVALIHTIECKAVKGGINFTRGIIILGTAIGTALYVVKMGNVRTNMKIGLLCSVPAASSLLLSLYYTRKADKQKQLLLELLAEFKNLSTVHSEVNEFIKHFNYTMETSTDELLQLSEEAIYDLSKHTCDIQLSITKLMKTIIRDVHTGLLDISLDLSGFEQSIVFPFDHESLSDCLRNVYFVEGQMVLLRSHLLTSVILVSSSRGDLAMFEKVMDEYFPALLTSIKDGIQKIRHQLYNIRFPQNPPALMSLSKLENIIGCKNVSVPKMRKHVIKINDGICCTLIKLRNLLLTLGNVESESQMVLLQSTVTNVTEELLKCCKASADLEKFIELVNRNQKNKELDLTTISELGEIDCATTNTIEQLTSEKDEPGTDSDYQVFGTDICDSDDDSEGNAVRFYKKHINSTVDWLAELKQSVEFQRRQTKFHTVKPTTSTPIEGIFPTVEPVKSVFSLEASTSSMEFSLLKIPPISSGVLSSADISEIMRDSLTSSSANESGFSSSSSKIPPPPPLPSDAEISQISGESCSTKESSSSSSSKIPPPPPPIPSDVLTPEDLSEILNESVQSGSSNESSSSFHTPPKADAQAQEVSSPAQSFMTESSSLLDSLKGVLDRMGPREEDEFE